MAFGERKAAYTGALHDVQVYRWYQSAIFPTTLDAALPIVAQEAGALAVEPLVDRSETVTAETLLPIKHLTWVAFRNAVLAVVTEFIIAEAVIGIPWTETRIAPALFNLRVAAYEDIMCKFATAVHADLVVRSQKRTAAGLLVREQRVTWSAHALLGVRIVLYRALSLVFAAGANAGCLVHGEQLAHTHFVGAWV